jgi:hypothetical protein
MRKLCRSVPLASYLRRCKVKEMYTRWLIAVMAVLGLIACDEASNCECSSADGPCCDGCNYYQADDNHICADVEDYSCADTVCGADALKNTGTKICQGGTAECTGEVSWNGWLFPEICGDNQKCETDGETFVRCTTCEYGCANGACWPECDPMTDLCCAPNGTWPSNTWSDSNNNLCWQDPPSASTMNWYVAAGVYDASYNETTEDYCGDLGGGWRLPTISELRSLFRSGTDTECEVVEWDMSWTSVPAGYCEIWDSCLSYGICWNVAECYPSACGTLEGPGSGGCYWDAVLSGTCSYYWSSSETEDYLTFWYVYFESGDVSSFGVVNESFVRCVRSGP